LQGEEGESDVCNGNSLTEYYCDGNNVEFKEVVCTNGCNSEGTACSLPLGGLFCEANITLSLPLASQKSRAQANDDLVYYCGLDLMWHETKQLDASCVQDYECNSNTCVDGNCISVTAEFAEQRSILTRIWCFLTNMREYLQNKENIDTYCPEGEIDCIRNYAPNYAECLGPNQGE
jgi:hypothetical protein